MTMRASIVRRLPLALVLLALLAAGGSLAVERPAKTSCKPVAPIDLDASIVGDPLSPSGVSARAVSRTGAEVELEIVLPPGVAHVAGERKMRGRQCDLRVDLRATDRNRKEIVVRATITDGVSRLTRVLPLVIFDGPPPPSKGRPARNSRGEQLLEFSP